MMKDNSKLLNVVGNDLLVLAGIVGIGGAVKAAYHKGKMDAYKDAGDLLKESIEDVEKYFAKKDEGES